MIRCSKQSSILLLEGRASETVKELIVELKENRSTPDTISTIGDMEVNESTFEPDILKLH